MKSKGFIKFCALLLVCCGLTGFSMVQGQKAQLHLSAENISSLAFCSDVQAMVEQEAETVYAVEDSAAVSEIIAGLNGLQLRKADEAAVAEQFEQDFKQDDLQIFVIWDYGDIGEDTQHDLCSVYLSSNGAAMLQDTRKATEDYYYVDNFSEFSDLLDNMIAEQSAVLSAGSVAIGWYAMK